MQYRGKNRKSQENLSWSKILLSLPITVSWWKYPMLCDSFNYVHISAKGLKPTGPAIH